MALQPTPHERITPTAYLTAYRRSLTDIPFAKDIFAELSTAVSGTFPEVTKEMLMPEVAPQFEARYKLLDRLIAAEGSRQVLEIAAGFCGRGLAMTADSSVTYVELDLPGAIQEKRRLLEAVAARAGMSIRSNLHLEEGNALDLESLRRAAAHFRRGPITVTNEGLLRYLSFDEKAAVATNIGKLLALYGGAWITPDITLKRILAAESAVSGRHLELVTRMTGRDIEGNRFENEEAAVAFFERLGYTIERHSFMEAKKDLVSPLRLRLSEPDVDALLKDAVVYVMRRQRG